MGDAKPWQIAVIVVGLLTLVGMVVWQMSRDTVQLGTKILLVDVETGQLIEAKLPERRAVSFPAKNPETQRATLFPAKPEEGGGWTVVERYIPYVKSKDIDPKAINLSNGSITVSGGPISKSVF